MNERGHREPAFRSRRASGSHSAPCRSFHPTHTSSGRPGVRDLLAAASIPLLAANADPAHPGEVQISRPSEALQARAAAKGAFTGLFLGLGAVALFVGAVGIANVMVISVLERRSEIGLRRALGATRRHIASQFITESLLLGLLGGVAGVLLGILATAGYAIAGNLPTIIPPEGVFGGLAAALLTGALAGLYPATRAARLAPTQALRSA
jgi:putative ABC transport system permease protein